MDIDEDAVPTSDVEELEELQANQPGYWTMVAEEMRGRRVAVQSIISESDELPTTSTKNYYLSNTTHRQRSAGCQDDDACDASTASCPVRAQEPQSRSPPRKRRKLDETEFPPSGTPLQPRTNLPSSPSTLAKNSCLIVTTPSHRLPDAHHSMPVHTEPTTLSQTSSLIRIPRTGSPPSSPDPLLLFTPPQRSDPPRAQSAGLPLPSPTFSPLTPSPSPTTPLRNHRSPLPAQRLSPSSDSFNDDAPLMPQRNNIPPALPQAEDEQDINAAAIELAQAEERSRYSLRTRNARQLNPYEFDKLLYKKQMRANPDAIVKVVSPPRGRRRQRSTSPSVQGGSSGVEDEYRTEGEDETPEDVDARRRRKGKEREFGQEYRGIDEEQEGESRSAWLPDALKESSSSGEDDEELLAGLQLGKKSVKERRPKRRKPFPMNRNDLHRSFSPSQIQIEPAHEPSPLRSRPRSRQRARVAVKPSLDGDTELQDPDPDLHRRQEAASSSQTRQSTSPPSSDDFLAPRDDEGDYNTFDDEFARGQSPIKFESTPAVDYDDTLLNPSSETHHPPTTDSEIIEISSDSGDDGESSQSGSSSQSMAEEDRKRLNILSRMMPKVMIKRLEMQARAKAARLRASASAERDDDDVAELPLRPGESRKRVVGRTLSSRSIEIRGDSESSDVEIPMSREPSTVPGLEFSALLSSDSGLSSGAESIIEPIGHQPRPKYGRPAHADNEDEGSSSDVSNVEDAVDRWVSGVRKQPSRPDTQVKERDLIDRMLSRTDVSSASRRGRKKRTRRVGGEGGTGNGHMEGRRGHRVDGGRRKHCDNSRPGTSAVRHTHTSGGGGGEGSSKLRVLTTGAKRHGARRQTLLPFTRLSSPQEAAENVVLDSPLALTNEVFFTGDEPAKAKQKATKLKKKTAGVYVFSGPGAHLTSGRANISYVTVNQEIAAPRGLAPLRSDQSVLPRKHGPSNEPRSTTLEDYWEAGDDHYEHDGFVVPDDIVPEPSSPLNRGWDNVHRVTDNLDIHPLPAGIAFPSTTYLGHGWLHELINILPGTRDIASPPSCSLFDCYLHAEMSAANFTACLEKISDRLRNLILGAAGPVDHETCRQWQNFLHSVSQHLSMLLVKVQGDDHATLVADMESIVRRLGSLMEEPVEILPEDEIPNPLVLQVLWFLLETTCRLTSDSRRRSEEPNRGAVVCCVQALLTKLWDYSFGDSAATFVLTRERLTQSPQTQQLAELWVCLVNLTSDSTFRAAFLPRDVTFWTTYLELLNVKGLLAPQTDLKTREVIWKSLFSLCAISQFSIHGNSSMTPRIVPSWHVVSSILERSPLNADPVADSALPRSSLRKRDHYVRTLVSRCLLLHLQWHWRLDVDDPVSMFNRLLDVFKSRKFASLQDEGSDLPGFLRHNNLALLQERKTSDTAFTSFLKLVVRAAEDMRKENSQLAPSQSAVFPQKLKKILSLAVPVSAVGFTKDKPPSSRDLSMLYNRFSAVAVAIYLEPVPNSVEYRVAKLARRYVAFGNADNETRRACIRGAMHLGILLRHLGLPLTDILGWLTEMTDILIDEYQTPEAVVSGPGSNVARSQRKDWIVLCIHLLLGCVRHILETSSMDPDQAEHKYPDPALLQGPWVTRVFSNATNLSTISSTGDEIRRLVQAFLDARARVIPRPRRPQPRAAVAEDSQEYDQFDLDLNDPELLAALGEDVGLSDHRENKEKDKVVCEIIDKHISPAIYRLICKHFNDPVYQQKGELSFQDADRWIDCWVGCASVVVQNGKKDWTFYLSYGPQSWEKIIEPDWRRRVGLRFMYMLLQLDPPAYLAYTESFIDVLFKCMATPNVTLEHDYAALLFSIDKLHHPLLHELPLGPPGANGDYNLTKQGFVEQRLGMIEAMIKSLSESLAAEAHGEAALTARNQTHITSVVSLLSSMKDICDQLDAGAVNRALYVTFCKQISDLLSRYPALDNHNRLATLVHWLRTVT